MSATTQHAAIAALVTLWDAALDIPVHDGPKRIGDKNYQALFVGYDPLNDDDQAVTSQQDWSQLGARRKEETGSIKCCVAAWSGDSETLGRRVQVADILSAAEAAHRADITLGGTVLFSNFGESVSLHQHLTDQGNEVMAVFTVTFKSRT